MKHSDFIENKQRGSRDLPVQLYRVDKDYHEYIMPLHWHREFEIIRVTSGSFLLYVNNIPYNMQSGDIAFVSCKNLHRGEPTDCCYDCIVMDLALLNKKGNGMISSYIDPLINGEISIRTLHSFNGSELYATVNKLFTLMSEKRRFYELAVLGLLYQLVEQIYTAGIFIESNQNKNTTGQTAAITELIEWIDENYSERITLKILSDKVGITPNYLCKIFKEYTGKTPIEYVNHVRIEGVCFDIISGNKNITTAAIANGYNDLSYFCKVFKKYKGMSAKVFANRVGNGELNE